MPTNLIGVESEIHVQCAPDGGFPNAFDIVRLVADSCDQDHPVIGNTKLVSCNAVRDTLDGFFHANGSRIYVDHSFVEYSTPECNRTLDAVAAVRAGDHLVARAIARASAETHTPILATRNNRDYAAPPHSYGAHVNVRMTREGFAQIFSDREVLHGFVIPLFVALPVICGSGCVDAENERGGFLFWQRGPFLQTLVGPQTSEFRPLINSRDEALAADSERYARFHIIAFDANIAEPSEFCKLGLLRLLCAAIDAGRIDLNMELADALAAIRSVSSNPFAPVRLAGGTTITPVEILAAYVGAFHRMEEKGVFGGRVPDAGDIVECSAEVLEDLRTDPWRLVGVLDWPTKLSWLEQFRTEHGLTWADPRLKWQDLRYHSLTGGTNPPLRLRRLTTDRQVRSLTIAPPKGSRAEFRGTLIRRFGGLITEMDWHWVGLENGLTLELPDDPTPETLRGARRVKNLANRAEQLGLRPARRPPVIYLGFLHSNAGLLADHGNSIHKEHSHVAEPRQVDANGAAASARVVQTRRGSGQAIPVAPPTK